MPIPCDHTSISFYRVKFRFFSLILLENVFFSLNDSVRELISQKEKEIEKMIYFDLIISEMYKNTILKRRTDSISNRMIAYKKFLQFCIKFIR